MILVFLELAQHSDHRVSIPLAILTSVIVLGLLHETIN